MNNLNKNISMPNDWLSELKICSKLDNINAPISYIKNEIENGKEISPKIDNIFNAFKYCSFSSAKVVIFGQDPYFQRGFANGLAFSVNKNQTVPASLRNIYKEIENDIGYVSNKDGCLENWAQQGVLLLNSSLSVEVLKPGSHSNIGWDKFIIDIIKTLNKKNNIVFILWGNHAKQYLKYIDNDNNLILSAAHPSPFSAYRGFFGSKHFSKCNSYLKKNNLKEIKW